MVVSIPLIFSRFIYDLLSFPNVCNCTLLTDLLDVYIHHDCILNSGNVYIYCALCSFLNQTPHYMMYYLHGTIENYAILYSVPLACILVWYAHVRMSPCVVTHSVCVNTMQAALSSAAGTPGYPSSLCIPSSLDGSTRSSPTGTNLSGHFSDPLLAILAWKLFTHPSITGTA